MVLPKRLLSKAEKLELKKHGYSFEKGGVALPRSLLSKKENAFLTALGFQRKTPVLETDYVRALERFAQNALERKKGVPSTKPKPLASPTLKFTVASKAPDSLIVHYKEKYGEPAREIIRATGDLGAENLVSYEKELIDAVPVAGPVSAVLVAEHYGKNGLRNLTKYGMPFLQALDSHHDFTLTALKRAEEKNLTEEKKKQLLEELAKTTPSILARHDFLRRISKGWK